jgi:hypothetical protein
LRAGRPRRAATPLEFLIAEFDKPPLARLAGLLDVAEDDTGPALDHLRTVFDVADTFVEAMFV